MRMTLIFVGLIASAPVASATDEVNLVCDGLVSFPNPNVSTGTETKSSQKTFTFKNNKLYSSGNIISCSSNESIVRCYERNKQETEWRIEIDRVSGKIDYSFANYKVVMRENFTGVCKQVNRVF